jgi:lysophospholipase L1-like esterase
MDAGVVLIVGDSLACPRPWIGVDLQSTYGHLLHRELGGRYFVANFAEGDNSTRRSIRKAFIRTYVERSGARFAIVQLGIVDCAPRLLSGFERILGAVAARVRLLGPLFNAYVRVKSRYRYPLTKMFPKTLVGIDEFEANYRALLQAIVANNPVQRIFLVNIACPGQMLRGKSYGIDRNVEEYNARIQALCDETPERLRLIDIHAVSKEHPDWITHDDGHHIHREAHAWLATTLAAHIRGAEAAPDGPDRTA